MFSLFRLFGKKNDMGVTTRNAYLDSHGYYLAQAQRKPIRANGHSAPIIPYALYDLLADKITKEFSIFVRWDIYSYRWALHTFQHTSSCRIKLKKKSDSGHRHFVRDGEKTLEELRSYSKDHENRFELILFDGPEKNEVAPLMIPMLKANGVIVMTDDFNDPYDFDRALKQFVQAGFKTLMITNPAPMFDTLNGALIYKPGCFVDL